jgi:hypothetical protein
LKHTELNTIDVKTIRIVHGIRDQYFNARAPANRLSSWLRSRLQLTEYH